MAGINKRYVRSKAKEWVLGESENGKPHIAISFHIKDPLDGVEKFVGYRGFFTEATTERTIESLRYLGFEGDDLSKLEGLDKNEVELVIEDEEYTKEGDPGPTLFTRVQWINQVRGPQVKVKLEGEKLGSFAALMKNAFRAHDAAAGKRVTRPAAAKAAPSSGPKGEEPPPMADDDIPF